MTATEIIQKRTIEIQVIKEQLNGVQRKIKNLTDTEEALKLGLARAENSIKRQKELLNATV